MIKTLLYNTGGTLIIIGAVLPLFLPAVAPWVFAAGALLFVPTQLADRYEGSDLIIRRLRRQQILGALALVVTAFMMFTSRYHIPPFRGSEWKILLMVAALLEVYTIFRIDHEEKKGRK